MNPFGLSLRQRIVSRVVFYLIVFGGLDVLSRLVVPAAPRYSDPGDVMPYVARAYHGVPVESVEELLVRASR